MKAVRKFTTFDELKSSESKATSYTLSLKKHNDLKKVIMGIRLIQTNQAKPKK